MCVLFNQHILRVVSCILEIICLEAVVKSENYRATELFSRSNSLTHLIEISYYDRLDNHQYHEFS